ncbi:hypothetical protein D3C71_1672880 [compost metagenome]
MLRIALHAFNLRALDRPFMQHDARLENGVDGHHTTRPVEQILHQQMGVAAAE